MTDEAIREMIGGAAAPCCPWGSREEDWQPAAIGLARLYADMDGRPDPTPEEIDAAAGAIVNISYTDAADLRANYPDYIPELEA